MPGAEHLDQITTQTRRSPVAAEPRVSAGVPATIEPPSHSTSLHRSGTLTESVPEPGRAGQDPLRAVVDEARELGDFHCVGGVWVLSCNNMQTQALSSKLDKLGQHFGAPIQAAITVASDYITMVNAIGGHNGVDIDGVVGLRGVIVTPRGSSLFEHLVAATPVATSGDINDFVVEASAVFPGLASALQIPAIVIFTHVS